ncbi:hypothetical protein CI109_100979 [Kwoniella shandongensis]|uniref:Stress-associated endoplasmic reticulum protein n=1 Tax=Kwoniella shandongensis TaxID=1734106 RepID=A0AAJ8LEZ9_9TREE
MPTNADIRRKNANFAARAQAGKKTARPPRSAQKRSVATWVLIAMGFLVVGGSECRSFRRNGGGMRRVGVDDEMPDIVIDGGMVWVMELFAPVTARK